jgi:GrpB-like predicted nucleotidyltransferase (UPF0157 family)
MKLGCKRLFRFIMITLMMYKSSWKTLFQKEKNNLFNLGIDNILKIEHIGSTAIQGMTSKPVIDILIGPSSVYAFNDSTGCCTYFFNGSIAC